MYTFCLPKAFKWLSTPEKKISTMNFAEFYYRQIAEKMLSKIPAMHYLSRKVDADQFVVILVRLRVPSAFVQPADSTPRLGPVHTSHFCRVELNSTN